MKYQPATIASTMYYRLQWRIVVFILQNALSHTTEISFFFMARRENFICQISIVIIHISFRCLVQRRVDAMLFGCTRYRPVLCWSGWVLLYLCIKGCKIRNNNLSALGNAICMYAQRFTRWFIWMNQANNWPSYGRAVWMVQLIRIAEHLITPNYRPSDKNFHRKLEYLFWGLIQCHLLRSRVWRCYAISFNATATVYATTANECGLTKCASCWANITLQTSIASIIWWWLIGCIAHVPFFWMAKHCGTHEW